MSSEFDTYRLYYGNERRWMESLRLLFAQANQKFEEIRCEDDDWYHVNSEIFSEQLPILGRTLFFSIYSSTIIFLEFNGIKYPPSMATIRFLARKLHLTGKSDLDQLKCDIIAEIVHQINEQYFQIWFSSYRNEIEKKEAQKLFLENYIPLQLKQLEKLFETYSKDGIHFVGNDITWIDLIVYDLLENLLDINGDEQILNNYMKIKKNREEISQQPNIVNYRKSRSEFIQ